MSGKEAGGGTGGAPREPLRAPAINRVGLSTLFLKEIRRFRKVWLQTVMSPLITTSLYFLVFGVALGTRLREVQGIPYIAFVVPGLIMLAMINQGFLNTSSSLFQSKMNGTVVDILVAPLGTFEIITGYVAAAVVRAMVVGLLVYAVAAFFIGFTAEHVVFSLLFAILVSACFAVLGLIAALWAEKYDHLALFPTFVLTPLTFLGGVFYSIDMLPAPWETVSKLNPILYVVNGMRYGLLGVSDVPVRGSFAAVALLLVLLLFAAWRLIASGYRLRS